MSEYRVVVVKVVLGFAASHFISFGVGGCVSLHVLNFRVGVTLTGVLDRHSLVYDFFALKRDMEGLLSELDHRLLLPASNPDLELVETGSEVEVRHGDRRYVFPASDVVVLPIPNTTAEKIAEYLGGRLARELRKAGADTIEQLEVEVEETPGQSAFWSGPHRA